MTKGIDVTDGVLKEMADHYGRTYTEYQRQGEFEKAAVELLHGKVFAELLVSRKVLRDAGFELQPCNGEDAN